MTKLTINIGSSVNKGDGDPTRTAWTKANNNFDELYERVETLEAGPGFGATVTQNIIGDVYSEDSTLLVDAVNGKIVGPIELNQALNAASNGILNLSYIISPDDAGLALAAKADQEISFTTTEDGLQYNYSSITSDGTMEIAGGSLRLTRRESEPLRKFGGTIATANGFYWDPTGDGTGEHLLVYLNSEWVNISSKKGPYTGDLTGSVFADDSTLLVDAVNGSIPWSVISNVPTFIEAGDSVSIGEIAGQVDIYGDVEFNTGTTQFQAGNAVTFNSSVDFNGVVNFDDAVIDWLPIVSGVLVNNGLPRMSTQRLDISGSVFADDSTLLVDSLNGKIVGDVSTANNWNITAATNTWTFGTSGDFTIPENSKMQSNAQTRNYFNLFDANLSGGITLNSTQEIRITSNGFYSGNDWTFGLTGNLSAPGDISATNFIGTHIGDLTGSVFADDSTLLVDAVNGTIPGYISIDTLKAAVSVSADFADFATYITNL